MSLPNIENLRNVTKFLNELESYKVRLEQLTKKLESTKMDYANKEKAEYKRVLDTEKTKINLKQIDAEIIEIREKELEIRENLYEEVSSKVDNFVDGDKFSEFFGDLLEEIKKQGDAEICAGDDVSNLLPDGVKSKKAEDGVIKITVGVKTYIVSPEVVKKQLYTNLLYKILPTE